MNNDNQLPPAPVAEEPSSEPVAWRYRVKGYDWELFGTCPFAGTDISPGPKEELEPLYTHPQPAVDVDALAEFLEVSDFFGFSPAVARDLAMQICNWIEEQRNDQ